MIDRLVFAAFVVAAICVFVWWDNRRTGRRDDLEEYLAKDDEPEHGGRG